MSRPHPPKQASRLFWKIDFYNDLEFSLLL